MRFSTRVRQSHHAMPCTQNFGRSTLTLIDKLLGERVVLAVFTVIDAFAGTTLGCRRHPIKIRALATTTSACGAGNIMTKHKEVQIALDKENGEIHATQSFECYRAIRNAVGANGQVTKFYG